MRTNASRTKSIRRQFFTKSKLIKDKMAATQGRTAMLDGGNKDQATQCMGV
tara:strand:+ start:405 stop:557 length:153 start_codon:yes stop_codon:yes gene_type:complete